MPDLAARRRLAFRVAVPALGATWVSGFLLAHRFGFSLLSLWILGALFCTVVSLQGVLFCASKEPRRGPGVTAVIVLPLLTAVALMVFRPDLGDP